MIPAAGARGNGAIAPGAWLGVLGGGQLGRMFCHAAQALGYRVCVLDPAAESPAAAVADAHICAGYDDAAGLAALAERCAAVTTEFENVPARSLEILAAGTVVRPHATAVSIAQERAREKAFFQACGVEVAAHFVIASEQELRAASAAPGLFPGILKTARLGYDGKGQVGVAGADALESAWRSLGAVPCLLERRLRLRRELSVIVARGADGATAVFPPCENEHRDGILALTVMPARIDAEQSARAQAIAARVAARLAYVGVLCVELFELDDGRLLANEMAPRPHNSGHATIDACGSSQFDQQVRALAGMPLGEARMLAPAVMLNLLGDLWLDARRARRAPDFAGVLAVPGACLHLYGKREARSGRKMGHVTVLGRTMAESLECAGRVAALLGLDALAPALSAPGPAAV